MIVPLLYALLMSLFDYRVGAESKGTFLFLANYLRFVEDPLALSSLSLTLLFTFCAVSCEIVLGVGMAVFLSRLPAPITRLLRGVYCMPLLISPIIFGLMWRYMYDPTFGLVYFALSSVGLDRVFGGLQQPGWAMFCIILADVWETTPFVLLCVTAGLVAIPYDIYEASKSCGRASCAT